MSDIAEVKKYIDEAQTAFTAFKDANDLRVKALEENRDGDAAELQAKLDKINADLSAATEGKRKAEIRLDNIQERMEEMEAKNDGPPRTELDKTKDEYKTVWESWLRNKGQDSAAEQKMQQLMKDMAGKAVTVGSAPGGGYAVPEEISREIERLELLFSPVRRLVKVRQAGTSDYKELVNIRGTAGGWVGESDARPETATSQLREVTPSQGELYAYPQASEWSLDDVFFDVPGWLAEEVGEIFAQQEGQAVLTGNGVSKPIGMLNTAPVATADFASPMRAAQAYQFVPTAATPAAINMDALISLQYTLRAPYRARAAWTFNSNTAGAIRQLKTSNGDYLWQPSVQAGQPDMLLGRPVEIWEDMQDVGNNNHPVAFGDFQRGYVLVDRVGQRITRDDVTNIGFVRFYVRRREGGIPLNNDAIKFLKTT